MISRTFGIGWATFLACGIAPAGAVHGSGFFFNEAQGFLFAQAPAAAAPSVDRQPLSYYANSGPNITDGYASVSIAPLFVVGALDYLGLTNYYAGNPLVSQAILDANRIKTAGATEKKEVLTEFLSSHSGEPINAAIALYYFMSFLPDEHGPISVEEFERRVPDVIALGDAATIGVATYFYMDQAWQAQAEGDGPLALAFFRRCKEVSLAAILAHPTDPETTLALANYSVSAQAEGPEAAAECVAQLKDLVAKNPASLVGWFARNRIAYIAQTNELFKDKNEHVAQYEKMLDELQSGGFVDAVLNSPKVTTHTKTETMMMMGHTYFANGMYDDAEIAYKRALELAAIQYEWNPRDRGREIVSQKQYGLRNMSAYSLVLARHVKLNAQHADDVIPMWKEFVDAFPNAEHADYALLDLGRLQGRMLHKEDAKATFAKIVQEHPESGLVPDAQAELQNVTTALRRE
jgi:tetratricopeptide (TPR) repeat protein